jgi:hypothetical protein
MISAENVGQRQSNKLASASRRQALYPPLASLRLKKREIGIVATLVAPNPGETGLAFEGIQSSVLPEAATLAGTMRGTAVAGARSACIFIMLGSSRGTFHTAADEAACNGRAWLKIAIGHDFRSSSAYEESQYSRERFDLVHLNRITTHLQLTRYLHLLAKVAFSFSPVTQFVADFRHRIL